jgi:hypothetical protein
MTPEEAIQVADTALIAQACDPLTDIQRMILRESLADKTYEQMEGEVYSTQYIKNKGQELWDLLSQALGMKVSKTSFRGALENRLQLGLSGESFAVPGTEELLQGEDPIELEYSSGQTVRSTWNKLFADIAPVLIDEASELTFRIAIGSHISRQAGAIPEKEGYRPSDYCYNSIVVQFRALGLITKSESKKKRDAAQNTWTYWSLTPYGDNVMTNLRAMRRNNSN